MAPSDAEGTTADVTADHSRGSVRYTWRPGRRLWFVLIAASVGSLLGLVFGVMAINRPVANAAAFYVLGAGVAAVLAAIAVLVRSLTTRRRRERTPDARGGR